MKDASVSTPFVLEKIRDQDLEQPPGLSARGHSE